MQKNKKYLINHYLLGLLIIWSILSYFTILLAQQNEIILNKITSEEGLLDDVATAIVQDANGLMWFGTRSGLVRYDGIKLENFTYDPNLPDGLSGNNILGLHIDKSGVLWIGTINGLCRFDQILDRPVKITIKIDDQFIYPYIQGITSSNNGLIWIATLDDGIISYDPNLNKSVQYLSSKNGLLSNRSFELYCASDGILWICTDKGLNSYDQEKQLFKTYLHEKGNAKTISSNSIISISEGTDGDLWLGTLDSGLDRFNTKKGLIANYKREENNNSINANYVRSLHFNENELWIGIGRGSNGLDRLDTETGIFENYKITNQNQEIFGSSTNEILIDKTGIVWISRSLNGINYFDPSLKNYKKYLIDNSGMENLVNRIYGIYPVTNTQLWASTFDGLVLFDLQKGVQKHIRDNGDLRLLHNNAILVNNELWIPTRTSGILRYNLNSEKITYINQNSNNEKGISSNYVNILLKDKEGIVWSGSRDGGLDRINPKTNIVKRYNHIPGNSESLPDNSVYALFELNENELWIGTNGGLGLFNKNNESFENYYYNPNDTSSLSAQQVSYILKSKNGSFWISSYGGGLNKFDADKKTFQRFTSQKNNIPNNTVYSLIEDDKSFLWVSTAKGIARFSPITGTYDYLIDLPDNYKVNKFPNGNIIFSGPRGMLVFDPNKIKYNSSPPIVSLSKFNINSEVSSKVNNDSLKYTLAKKGSIELNHFENDLDIQFTVAHYSDASKNKLSVFLEGYDINWRSLGSVMSINYTNLDPGKYILKAKGASAYGVWTEEPISYRIIINPPWWKTWWAYLSYIFVGLGLLYSIRSFELNRQYKNTAIKESKLRAETAEFQAKAAEAQSRVIQAENDRKSQELEEARQLQLSMLPKQLPKIQNLDIAVYMKTATEVGGDYYDFAISDDGTLNVGIGDATGHGMQAGTIVTLIKGLYTSEVSKKELLTFLRETSNAIKGIELGRLMMAFSLLKIKGNKVQFSSAGMPPMYIYRSESNIVEEINLKGMPLGAIKNFEYKLYNTELRGGDCLLLMSDGYPELENSKNEQIGYERLKTQFAEVALKQPDDIIQYFKDSGSEWVNDKEPDDDVTFVVIKMK
jgi:serine phosphatase RsbU (regulator of sigma subunit)/ligand-binding sensor domain-containing protein